MPQRGDQNEKADLSFLKTVNCEEVLKIRLAIARREILDTPKEQAAVKKVLRHCINSGDPDLMRMGVCIFFNFFLWTYDPRPRTGSNHVPFILWKFQVDYLQDVEKHYHDQEDFLTIKSRDMGATWMFCGWNIYHFLFDDSFNAHIIGKKEDDLDNKQIDTVFPKMKYMLRRLPKWMLPAGFSFNKNTGHYTHLKISHPTNVNSITGESANPEAGRSRRYSILWLDEFAVNDYDYAIWQGTADTVDCRAPVGTPKGKNNKYAKLYFSGDIDVLTLHWRFHPLKGYDAHQVNGKWTSTWYEKQCKRRTSDEIASEIDMSFSGSQQGLVYKEFDRTKHLCDIDYDESLPLYCTWDFGIGDATAILWIQTLGHEVRIIDAFECNDRSIDFYVPIVSGAIPKKTGSGEHWKWEYSDPQRRLIEKHGMWRKPDRHYGDDDCKKREKASGSSVYLELMKYKINIFCRRVSLTDRINDTKDILKGRILVNRKLAWVADCFENYHWPVSDDGEIKAGSRPVHDAFSHTMTAFEFFCSLHRFSTATTQYHGPQNIVVGDSDMGY